MKFNNEGVKIYGDGLEFEKRLTIIKKLWKKAETAFHKAEN